MYARASFACKHELFVNKQYEHIDTVAYRGSKNGGGQRPSEGTCHHSKGLVAAERDLFSRPSGTHERGGGGVQIKKILRSMPIYKPKKRAQIARRMRTDYEGSGAEVIY